MTSPDILRIAETNVPLCVDLDGTLIRSDLLWESLCQFFRQHTSRFSLVFWWLMKGRAHLKRRLAENIDFDPALLPFNQPFVDWLTSQKAAGRPLILCTAADRLLANRVATHVGLFDEVLGSDGHFNLKGRHKAKTLSGRFGNVFDYAGNSGSDWEIWRVCRQIIAVETPWWVTRRLESSGRLIKLVRISKPPLAVWRRALRIHQWAKNLLIFMPLIASHNLLHPGRLLPTGICFVAFSLVASATYLVNDLLDLAADRVHPRKRLRPVAAGELSIPAAVAASAALFTSGVMLAIVGNTKMVAFLIVVYTLTSLIYSFRLKKTALLDVYVLSGLYTLRIVAGGMAGNVQLSGWFLSFSVFLFLSLGFAKRAAELHRTASSSARSHLPGRGYMASDFQPVMCFGIAAAFAATLVLSLYLQSSEVQSLYHHPALLWTLFPACLYWLTRVWLLASRGALHEDPISFAIRDPLTWVLIAVCAVIVELAASPMRFSLL